MFSSNNNIYSHNSFYVVEFDALQSVEHNGPPGFAISLLYRNLSAKYYLTVPGELLTFHSIPKTPKYCFRKMKCTQAWELQRPHLPCKVGVSKRHKWRSQSPGVTPPPPPWQSALYNIVLTRRGLIQPIKSGGNKQRSQAHLFATVSGIERHSGTTHSHNERLIRLAKLDDRRSPS